MWVGSILVTICTLLCILLFVFCKSKDRSGNRIEIENNTDEEPWSLRSWIAGVFVAGTGVALMYAPSDLTGYIKQGLNPVESVVMMTLLNGALVWSLYSVVGIWYMKHWDSKVGKIAAMVSTLLGMAISLWTGSGTILKFIGTDKVVGLSFMIAFAITAVAIVSARFNLLKKVSIISFSIFIIAFLVLISVPETKFVKVSLTGGITKNFWKEYFTGATSTSWIFWFISWTPTVSRWLAQISKGRTMREYIGGTMLLPTALALIWMIVSWIRQDLITSFSLVLRPELIIPCVIFTFSGIMFMIGTLDSDCKVFTEDLEVLTKGRVKRDTTKPLYGLLVLFVFCLYDSGITAQPFKFNEYSSTILIPLVILGIYDSTKLMVRRRRREKGGKI